MLGEMALDSQEADLAGIKTGRLHLLTSGSRGVYQLC